MADPVAAVEKIVKLGLVIKEAVDTVRHNEDECREIRKRVLRFSSILSQLQQTGMMTDSPAMSGALEDLEESLHQGLELVMACQERSTIRRLVSAGDLAKQLRRVKDDILNKVMLASFAINVQTTIVLLTIQAGGHPLLQQQDDTGVTETSHNRHSTNFTRFELYGGERTNILAGSGAPYAPVQAFREYELSELKAATNNFANDNIIGRGGHSTVYKGVLNDGNVVSIKTLLKSHLFSWENSYDIHLIVSKLQNKNIVKIVGHGALEVQTPPSRRVAWFFKRREYLVTERQDFWVEEYLPNGSLHRILNELSQLDWSSLFRIIKGVAQGMHCVHEQDIVHMDMTPSNVLMDSDMNPKIIDFGISQVAVQGTMGYIAPEHLQKVLCQRRTMCTLLESLSLILLVVSTCLSHIGNTLLINGLGWLGKVEKLRSYLIRHCLVSLS
ncbi:unnamed protein product [Urochloa humidicola]